METLFADLNAYLQTELLVPPASEHVHLRGVNDGLISEVDPLGYWYDVVEDVAHAALPVLKARKARSEEVRAGHCHGEPVEIGEEWSG